MTNKYIRIKRSATVIGSSIQTAREQTTKITWHRRRLFSDFLTFILFRERICVINLYPPGVPLTFRMYNRTVNLWKRTYTIFESFITGKAKMYSFFEFCSHSFLRLVIEPTSCRVYFQYQLVSRAQVRPHME